jgi:hypothetical protein
LGQRLSGRSLSNSPDHAYRFQYAEPTAKVGKVSAPSFNDRDRSTNASTSMSSTTPSPWQLGHMPAGWLNENTLE